MPSKDGRSPSNDGKLGKRPIDLLFGSGARLDVLWCLMRYGYHGLMLSEIAQSSQRSLKDVQRALSVLQDVGLITRVTGVGGALPGQIDPAASGHRSGSRPESRGRTRYYLSQLHPWIPPLRMLLECALGGVDLIREKLSGVAGIRVAFLFGSFATSEQNRESDIDLMAIGTHDQLALEGDIPELEKRVGREIQVISYSPDEWRKKFEERSHFVVSLMDAPKVYLIGDARELEKIVLGAGE
jgi:predicted nucleotidyltransferase